MVNRVPRLQTPPYVQAHLNMQIQDGGDIYKFASSVSKPDRELILFPSFVQMMQAQQHTEIWGQLTCWRKESQHTYCFIEATHFCDQRYFCGKDSDCNILWVERKSIMFSFSFSFLIDSQNCYLVLLFYMYHLLLESWDVYASSC